MLSIYVNASEAFGYRRRIIAIVIVVVANNHVQYTKSSGLITNAWVYIVWGSI